MKRAAEWFLALRETPLERAHDLIINHTPTNTVIGTREKPVEPVLYDTARSADEGLWLRTGWAGRG